jgi:5-methylcytosine-specific restriction enzyme subunit McrC
MNAVPYFIFSEHSYQEEEGGPVLSEIIKEDRNDYNFSDDNTNYLGLSSNFMAHYYIGMRWIEFWKNDTVKKGVIWVKPKRENIKYEKLLWRCLKNPIVRNHLSECYQVFPYEPSIPVPSENFYDFITPLLVTDFVVRVNTIVKKGLKRCFAVKREEMTGKTKGKILVNQTIRQQLKLKTINKTVCQYQDHNVNTIENKILKVALLQSLKYVSLYMPNQNEIKNILISTLASFEEVDTITINNSDFLGIAYSPFYSEYKTALKLAQYILKCYGFSSETDIKTSRKTIPPYYINMPELFERYCEVLLREKYKTVLAGYGRTGHSDTRLGSSKLRPDFILPQENMIIDSKYKYWIEGSDDDSGIKQMAQYSRHEGALKKLQNDGKLPVLQFLYPSESENAGSAIEFESDTNEKIKDYIDIYKYPLLLIR